ncbi:MAG: Fic family protein [Limosilactobacillus sp.]|jgi:cell filamentation protein|uniref:Fic/DOC family protein n=1 Tax=Limosilactobacillus sp. TaxID=2773925 RepID=UPI0025BCB660|nr:Fic family protein [Limosilactobacillus sp.]MCI1974427.1 Fic family protein [Limosilactobacillus sp.]
MKDEELKKRFLYPNGTLRNKLNLQDANELSTVEYRTVAHNAIWLLHHGYVIKNMDDFAKIHRFLFSDIYTWAGQFRNYYLTKGGTDFMPPTAFDTATTNINQQLETIKATKKPTVEQYAKLLDSLNYLHPFREGNGRTTRLFIQLLAANHAQYIDYNRQDSKVIEALNQSDLIKLQDFIKITNVKSVQESFINAAK